MTCQMYLQMSAPNPSSSIFSLDTNHPQDRPGQTLKTNAMTKRYSVSTQPSTWLPLIIVHASLNMTQDKAVWKTKWFSRYLQNIGIKTVKTSFHSFRRNLKDFFRAAGISEELSEHYLGRLTGKTGEAYGSGHTVKSYASAVAKIEFSDYVGSQPTANLGLQYQPSKQDGG